MTDHPYTISRRSMRRYTVCVPVGEDQRLKLIGSIARRPAGDWYVTGALTSAEHETFHKAIAWLLAHEYGEEPA